MSEKITGYTLLIFGVVIMTLCVVNIFMVFTKKASPVQLFNYSGISLDLSSLTSGLNETIPQNSKNAFPTKKSELISGAMLNDSSNLLAHIFLIGFVSSFGFKISSLGVQLIRPVVVKLKAKDGSEIPTVK